jgi:hypothetical protein
LNAGRKFEKGYKEIFWCVGAYMTRMIRQAAKSSGMMRSQARSLVCCRSRQVGRVFSAWPYTSSASLEEVQDALMMTQKMRESDARDYMLSIGLDYDNIKKYLGVVCRYEELYRQGVAEDSRFDGIRTLLVCLRTMVTILLEK